MARILVLVVLGVLPLVACGGGGGDDLPEGGEVASFSGFLFTQVPSAFVVEGQGFGPAGSTARLRLTATGGLTPFDSGTSASGTVDLRVLSGSRAIGFTSPTVNQAFTAIVEVLRSDGAVLEGPGVLANFTKVLAILIGPDDETIVGTPGPDLLDGGTGYDRISGGAGNDTLLGGSHDDTLRGEEDDDILTGGPGRDAFVVEPGTDFDRITDYEPDRDRLLLPRTLPGLAAFDVFAGVTDGGPGADVVVTWTAGGTLTFEGHGTGTIDDVAELILSGVSIHPMP